jgi:hypothetical protein
MPNIGRNIDHEHKLLKKLTKSNVKLNKGQRVARAAGVVRGSIIRERPSRDTGNK